MDMRTHSFSRWALAATLVGGCGGDDSSDGSAGGSGDTSGATGMTSGVTADGTADNGDTANSGNDSTMGGDSGSDGSGTGDGGDASLPFSCQGFVAPTGPGEDGVVCFYDVEDPDGEPAASLQLFEVDLNGTPSVYVQLIFAPWFVDNTYGAEAVGWDGGHTFKDLDGSDHALIPIGNTGETDPLLILKLDYIDEDDTVASGYRCLGVWGGEGNMELGDEAAVLAANSSLSRNLNERGYATYIEDSPATDVNYTPNPAAPDWDYRVVYEAWVDASIFTDPTMVEACIDSIHASPAKIGDNTVEVFPDECPPGWGCFTNGDCDECTEPADPDSPSVCDPGDGFPPIP
jgi:hypothetical protein